MSDPDAAPDPMDKAYVQAEAVLEDEAARAARRARVLAAVAQEPATAAEPPPSRWPAQRHAGWLAAACVAGLSVLVAIEVRRPVAPPPPSVSPEDTAPVAAPPQVPPAPDAAPAAAAQSRARPSAPTAAEPRSAPPPARDVAPAAPLAAREPPAPPAPPSPAPPPPAPAPAAPPAATPPASASRRVEEVVVTGSRIEAAPAYRAGSVSAPGSTAERAARLHAAAAAGRTREVAALLARGVPVDAVDEAGETALMKAVQGRHAATAALLRRRDASLDLKNQAGVSAREMADKIGDAALNQALGLGAPER